MATVGRIRFAGADPYGRLPPAFFLRRNPTGQIVRTDERPMPSLVAVAERLLDAGAPELAAAGSPLPDALEALCRYLPADSAL